MILKDYPEFMNSTRKTLFSGLKVKTTSGFEGYLHHVSPRVATLTKDKCNPELECPLHFVNGMELEDINNWEVLEINSKPIVNEELQRKD